MGINAIYRTSDGQTPKAQLTAIKCCEELDLADQLVLGGDSHDESAIDSETSAAQQKSPMPRVPARSCDTPQQWGKSHGMEAAGIEPASCEL